MRNKNIAVLAAALSLAGCQQYLARQDLIEPYSGNAVATNSALQVGDPWPSYVYDTRITTSGERQGNAIRKYKTYGEEEKAVAVQPVQLVVPTDD